MEQKNQTESGDWRKSVSNLEALPDTEAIDTAVLWTRLRSRPVKKRKFLVYYIVAAAVLVGVVFVISFLKLNQQHPADLGAQEISDAKPAPVIAPSTRSMHSEKTLSPNVKSAPSIVKKVIRKPNVPVPVATNEPSVTEPIVEVITKPDSSTIYPSIAAVPVKKLKVLHINEITPVDETGKNIARQSPRDMRRNRKEMKQLRSFVTHRSSDNIIKINLPSN